MSLSDNDEFNELVRKAIEAFKKLTPEEQAAHRKAQRVSWVYGELKLAGRDVTMESVRQQIEKYDEENPS